MRVNGARVIGTDIAAENGMIHIIDTVLLPDLEAGSFETLLMEAPTKHLAESIEDRATEGLTPEDREFEVFNQLAEAADLYHLLEAHGPYTVFAPTDAAFEAYFAANEMTLSELMESETLLDTLMCHTVAFPYLGEDLVHLENGYLGTLCAGMSLHIEAEEHADATPSIMVNGAAVGETILSTDAVLHGVDSVLMPTMDAAE